MYQNLTGNTGVDPNLGRVLEETVLAVRELDDRLRTLKTGITQVFPHLAPSLADRDRLGAPGLMGQVPFAPLTSLPQQGYAPGVSPFQGPPYGQFGVQGINPFAGVPYGAPGVSGLSPWALLQGAGIQQTPQSPMGTPPQFGVQGHVPGFQSGIGATGGIGSFRGFL